MVRFLALASLLPFPLSTHSLSIRTPCCPWNSSAFAFTLSSALDIQGGLGVNYVTHEYSWQLEYHPS